jgi:hypothetical protein
MRFSAGARSSAPPSSRDSLLDSALLDSASDSVCRVAQSNKSRIMAASRVIGHLRFHRFGRHAPGSGDCFRVSVVDHTTTPDRRSRFPANSRRGRRLLDAATEYETRLRRRYPGGYPGRFRDARSAPIVFPPGSRCLPVATNGRRRRQVRLRSRVVQLWRGPTRQTPAKPQGDSPCDRRRAVSTLTPTRSLSPARTNHHSTYRPPVAVQTQGVGWSVGAGAGWTVVVVSLVWSRA